MKAPALIILAAAIALSAAITFATHGRIVLIVLPIILGAAGAAMFGGRRR